MKDTREEAADMPGRTSPAGSMSQELQDAALVALVLAAAGASAVAHASFHLETVYTHLFYIPISLTALRWGKGAVIASVFLALSTVGSHIMAGRGEPVFGDVLRGGVFILVGGVLGKIVEERNLAHREALLERKEKILQMESHVEYVERMAHTLRNPIQACMGALQSMGGVQEAEGRRELIELMDRSVEDMRRRLADLTRA